MFAGLVGERNTPPVIINMASKVGLPLEEITLAKALAAANYSTAAVGECSVWGCRDSVNVPQK